MSKKNFGTIPIPGKANKKGKKLDKNLSDFIND